MIVLVGDTSALNMVRFLQRLHWGRMVVTNNITPYEREPWGFDNGAFVYWRRGEPFNRDEYLRRLERASQYGYPYLAVVPDIVCGGERSLLFSLEWLNNLPRDWPWYLAVQNGMTPEMVEPFITRFRGLFLGGDDLFKWSAPLWRELATKYGKCFHYGRAGTLDKLDHAAEVGVDSLDSAFPLWTIERTVEFAERWLSLHCSELKENKARRFRMNPELALRNQQLEFSEETHA